MHQVLICAIAVFASGYALQRHSIRNLQTSLAPRQIKHLKQDSTFFHSEHRTPEGHPSDEILDWSRLAHVQIATDHHCVCSAVMVLASLHASRSPARRILFFEREWAREEGQVSDPYIAASRRLLRRAARRYGVELRPVDMSTRDDKEIIKSEWLTGLDAALTLDAPAIILNGTRLDSVLAESAVQTSSSTTIEHVLVKPYLHSLPSVSMLRNVSDDFVGLKWLADIAGLVFSDSTLPGPEYDIPFGVKVAARPANRQADWIWTKMYRDFSQQRLDVCGLGLESWHEYNG